jgi:tRNA(Ile)-lysidine synthase
VPGSTVLDAIRQTIRHHGLLAGGETVLVAISGGCDSTALLHALQALAPELNLRLHALHVDHGLRPESGAEADAVRGMGEAMGIAIEIARVVVDRGGSLEAAARRARYAALDACARRIGAHRIALGHTADDQAETVLMRVLEGAGVRGLAGIPVVRGRIIRPLIELRRAALAAWLREAGRPWIEDPSNFDRRFARNRIRHDVLPGLAPPGGGDVVAALNRVARQARGAVDAIARMAARELTRLAREEDGGLTLARSALAELPPTLAGEVLRQAAAGLGGRASLRAWEHRGLARALATPAPRRPFRLGGVRVDVSGDWIRLGRRVGPALGARVVPVPGCVALDEIGRALVSRLVPARGYCVPRRPHVVAFDADALPGALTVRARAAGDRFRPFGGGERRLKTFLIDARVPRWERDRLPLVIAGGEIVWVGGVRRGAQAPVGYQTVRVLELALEPLAEARSTR